MRDARLSDRTAKAALSVRRLLRPIAFVARSFGTFRQARPIAALPTPGTDEANRATDDAADADIQVGLPAPAARQAAFERRWLEHDLRRALAHDEFVLHYAPVVDLTLGRVVGAEAVVRWQHPAHGPLPPGRFMGAAEDCGLMDPVGLWLLRHACLQVGDWNDSGLPGLKVAVNLTAAQFLDPSLLSYIREALRISGIEPEQLEIDLAETAAIADHDRTRAVFGGLRDLGVATAIDDVGTSSASLGDLQKLPFDKLKIARELVAGVDRSPDRRAICTALVALARGLGLRAQAEGTQSEDEVGILRAQGCELYQGPCFSRPLAAADFRAALRYISHNVAELADRLEPPVGWRCGTRLSAPPERRGIDPALSCPQATLGR